VDKYCKIRDILLQNGNALCQFKYGARIAVPKTLDFGGRKSRTPSSFMGDLLVEEQRLLGINFTLTPKKQARHFATVQELSRRKATHLRDLSGPITLDNDGIIANQAVFGRKKYMPDFSLKKWYLDVADDWGDVYIGYCVSLKWGKVELNGLQHLWHSPETGVETQMEITKQSAPEYKGENQLVWQPKGIEAIWESADRPIKETLLDITEGKIVWQCTQPKAHASINSSKLSFSGWGYTECIDITVPVWKLPFRTLYWGRCHTDNHYLVWIRWDGKTRQNLIWFDGKCSQDFVIEEEKIIGSDFLLRLGENVPLRQGKIGSTIFQPFGNIVKILPKTILSMDESKWYNKGILEANSKAESATTIYEKVSW